MPIDLDADLEIPQCSRYTNPADGAAFLPLCYGDTLSALAVPNDHEDGGFFPAEQVDKSSWGFALNAKPIPSSPAPLIYVGDYHLPQNSSVYTFYPSINFQGKGLIAGVQFHVNPGSNKVSWRGYGTADGAGSLLQNPVLGVFDALSTYAGVTLADFDLPISYEALRVMEELGAQFRWAFTGRKTIREWLTEIFRCYYIDFWQTADGKLALQVDKGILGYPVTLFGDSIHAQTDLVGTQGSVRFTVDEQNLFNTLTVKRRMKWTTHTFADASQARVQMYPYTDEPTVDHRPSVNLYGVLRGEIELPAVYTDSHGLIWVKAFFARYGYLPALVDFTVRGLGYASAIPGTYLGFIWPLMGWNQPRLLKVLNQTPDPRDDGMNIQFTCFDCQRFVADAFTLPSATITSVRRNVRVTDTTVDITPPGPASNLVPTGSYRQIVLRWKVPMDRDYLLTEIWASGSNNRATATFIRNGGVGAQPGSTVEETFAVAPTASYFVWLMTVDKSYNGRNGGTGPSGGNWFPSSATNGVFATTTLVDTDGMATESVTFTYGANFTATPGTYTGETLAAIASIGITFPQGDVIAFANYGIQIPSLHTATLQIRRASIIGATTGINYVVNPLTVAAGVRVDCWGLDFNPAFGGNYYATVQVVNQSGVQRPFVLNSAALFLRHTKR